MSRVAVVILNYNGEKFLQQFLPFVLQYSQGTAIVVADNASTDTSVSILRQQFPTVRLLQLEQNYGFCGGYNRALKQVEADYYVLLNSDVEVTAHWLEPMLALMESNGRIGAVQPKIRAYHQRSHFEYAGAGGGFIDLLAYPFCRGRIFDAVEMDEGQYNDDREIFWATGACMLVRSEVYHKLGGLDEDFFAHMEEIDLCWRMKRSGYTIYYAGNSTVYHVGGGTLSKINPRKTYLNFRNGLALMVKNLPWSSLGWKLPLRMALDLVAALRFVVQGQLDHAGAVLRALGDFIMTFNKHVNKRSGAYPKISAMYPGLVIGDYFIRKRKPQL